MTDVEMLAGTLLEELSAARRSLGLPDVAFATLEEMLAETVRISELIGTRMREVEDQLATMETTRVAARSYLISDSPT